jgi:hypothetical protein
MSDRYLSAKLVPTFVDRRCHVVSVTDLYGCILGFLDRTQFYKFYNFINFIDFINLSIIVHAGMNMPLIPYDRMRCYSAAKLYGVQTLY